LEIEALPPFLASSAKLDLFGEQSVSHVAPEALAVGEGEVSEALDDGIGDVAVERVLSDELFLLR